MRLKRFSVKGYKNFTQEVVLEDMGPVCVIHGENNVGKSNLLQAISLFLFLLEKYSFKSGFGDADRYLYAMDFAALNFEEYLALFAREFNIPVSSIFPFSQSGGSLFIKAQFSSNNDQFVLTIANDASFLIEKWFSILRDTKTGKTSTEISSALGHTEAEKIFETLVAPHCEFVIISLDRRISAQETDVDRNIIPHSLMLQLYDLRDELDPARYKRWQLFVGTMKKFNDILGEGEFVSLFDRKTNRANLAFESPTHRTPVELLGSGIQQLIALVARLLVTDAAIVCIEEPELNLRYSLQERLQEVFVDITQAEVGPEQIILSSHSPAFETGEYFYAMEATPDGPVVSDHEFWNELESPDHAE